MRGVKRGLTEELWPWLRYVASQGEETVLADSGLRMNYPLGLAG